MARFPFSVPIALAFTTALVACETVSEAPPSEKAGRESRTHVVAAAHPVAVAAGEKVLRDGGSAADAAVAIQATLTLVEPQSSGIGGGLFALYYDSETGEITAYDGREIAPAGATPTLFLDDEGEPLGLLDAVVGGHSIGVPGAVDALGKMQAAHGKLDWAQLFDPAIAAAENGFEVTPRMSRMIERIPRLDQLPAARAYFYTEEGEALPVGTTLTNPKLAETFRRLADGGPRSFYEGPVAETIVAAATGTDVAPSTMSLEDLAGYEARVHEPICAPVYTVTLCSAPPPSSGSIVLNIQQMIARFDIADQQGWTPRAAHIVAEAMRLGYADRDRFMADPAFADVPYKAIASPAYARERAALIDPEAAMAEVAAGEPTEMAERASDSGPDAPSTSHFSIRDADGDIVSVTTSVEFPFGSHIMAGGFILNNQLTDFAFEPVGADGKRKANALAPGKRPRSSMSPVIVLDEAGRPLIATGSPGGTAIIAYVVKSLVAMLEWGWAAEEAVAYTNLYARGDTLYLEEGQAPEPLIEALETLGHSVETRRLTSGAHIVSWNGEIGAWQGAADPRREGTVSIWREGEADGDGSQE